ncbi:hypothetical protein ENTCAN_05335 [Enterobacter cancerogenus ATCC 35316]|nr:hypothetical protein ENTCAN_05335 [Enterobacter cancerogenus ATCC 35316]
MNTNCLTLGLTLIKRRLWHINIIYEIEAIKKMGNKREAV